MPGAQKVYGRRVARTTSYITDSASTANHDRFQTPLKRTASAKRRRPSLSAPSKRQQTITQMNPFYSIYHPEIENDDLSYEADIGSTYETSNRAFKRQKTMTDEISVQGMSHESFKNEALEIAPRSGKPVSKAEKALGDQNKCCEDLGSSKMMPPPPKTPISRRRTEIPSSQSPADTPISSPNRRRFRECSRSPLKDKSLNIGQVHVSSPSKDRKLIDVREVPDSLENHRKGSSISSDDQGEPNKPRKAAEGLYEELLALPISVVQSPKERHRCVKSAETPYIKQSKQSPPPVAARSTHIRTEVVDSDMEEEDDGDLDPKDEAHMADSKVAAVKLLRQNDTTAPTCDTISSSIPEENPPRTTKEALRPATPSIDVPSSQPALPSSPPPTTTTQDLASDQIYHKLALYTQARGAPSLTTESQYECGWQSYHAPQSSLPLHPLSSPTGGQTCASEREMTPPQTATLPTQLLPRTTNAAITRKSNSTPPLKLPIPPSQATTVDVTQPPSTLSSSTARNSHRRPTSPRILLPSTPPPPAPPAPSSSPLTMMSKQDMSTPQQNNHYQWDGRVLTDSQLLPASLMEDSLDLYEPLGGEWRYEGLEGEEQI